MNIKILEERIEDIQDANLYSIIELIVDAVKDFPLFGMTDTDLYFDEIKKIIGSDSITKSSIEYYLKSHQEEETENDIWINSSLNVLLEAVSLMDLYKISFKELQDKIGNLI